MTAYLYVLADADSPAFKIGVSVDTNGRIAALPQRIDRSRSYQVRFPRADVYRAERTLHFLFREHHIERERCDGYTEWFHMRAYRLVRAFIDSNQPLLGWQVVEPVGNPSAPPAPVVPAKIRRRPAQDIEQMNGRALAATKSALEEWRRTGLLLSRRPAGRRTYLHLGPDADLPEPHGAFTVMSQSSLSRVFTELRGDNEGTVITVGALREMTDAPFVAEILAEIEAVPLAA